MASLCDVLSTRAGAMQLEPTGNRIQRLASADAIPAVALGVAPRVKTRNANSWSPASQAARSSHFVMLMPRTKTTVANTPIIAE